MLDIGLGFEDTRLDIGRIHFLAIGALKKELHHATGAATDNHRHTDMGFSGFFLELLADLRIGQRRDFVPGLLGSAKFAIGQDFSITGHLF